MVAMSKLSCLSVGQFDLGTMTADDVDRLKSLDTESDSLSLNSV